MQDNSKTDVNEALVNIVKGNVVAVAPEENIIASTKIKNEIMRKLAEAFRTANNDERYIVEILLALDESAEKGYLTNELFEEIQRNPDILTKSIK